MPDYLPYSLSQFEKKSTILFPQEGEKKTKLSNIKKLVLTTRYAVSLKEQYVLLTLTNFPI